MSMQHYPHLGPYYLFTAVILMGVIQMTAGILKLGKFIRLVPHPVMMGFVNGLAIVIFLSQLGMFKVYENGDKVWSQGRDRGSKAPLPCLQPQPQQSPTFLTKARPLMSY